MRKILYTLIILTTAFVSSCQKQGPTKEHNLLISGNIQGFKQGKLYLQQVRDSSLVSIDSITIDPSSNFTFQTNLESPEFLFLNLDRGTSSSEDNYIEFFAEPGTIQINTSLKNFYSDAKISGSKSNDIYNQYIKTRSLITDRQNNLLVDIFHAERENNQKTVDSLYNVSEKLSIRQYLNGVNFAINHRDSDVAPYIALTDLFLANTKYLEKIYDTLTPEVKANKYGKELETLIKERQQM